MRCDRGVRALGEDTLQRCRRVFGPDHLITLAAAGLTVALAELGEFEAARTLGHDTLGRCRRWVGPGHPITLYLAQVAGIGCGACFTVALVKVGQAKSAAPRAR